jgi:hypothetical protein
MQLNNEIANYGRFIETGKPWILWPYIGSSDREKFIRRAVKYRIENPYEIPSFDSTRFQDKLMQDEIVEQRKDYEKHYKMVLEKFSSNEP